MDHILPEPQEGCDKSFLGMLRQNESLKEDQRISEWIDEKKVDETKKDKEDCVQSQEVEGRAWDKREGRG